MDKQKLLTEVKQDFFLKRIRAEEQCEDEIVKLRENKDFDAIYTKYLEKKIEFLRKKEMADREELKKDFDDIKNKLKDCLNRLNIDENILIPKYECSLCKDTGVYNGKMCDCLRLALNKKITSKSSSQDEFKSFSNSNTDIMDETDNKVSEILKTWCDKYPLVSKINLNILGNAGSGKTFMLESVASELIKKGNVVIFKTAFELNELARLYHMGKSFEFSDLIDAEVLIIDDLGTEPILKNVTKEYLYNLINVRQVNKRPTLISTNLSLDNILDRYDERIFSRLTNKSLSINLLLTSKDKRIN